MTIQSERRVLGNDLRTSTDARLSPCQDKDTSRAVAARSGGIGRSLPQRKIIPAFGLPMDLRYSSKISAKAGITGTLSRLARVLGRLTTDIQMERLIANSLPM